MEVKGPGNTSGENIYNRFVAFLKSAWAETIEHYSWVLRGRPYDLSDPSKTARAKTKTWEEWFERVRYDLKTDFERDRPLYERARSNARKWVTGTREKL